MTEEFSKFLDENGLNDDSITQLMGFFEKGEVNSANVRRIVSSDIGMKISLINEITDRINNYDPRADKIAVIKDVEPKTEVTVGLEDKQEPEIQVYVRDPELEMRMFVDTLSTLSFREEMLVSSGFDDVLKIDPNIAGMPGSVKNYASDLNRILEHLTNFEKAGITEIESQSIPQDFFISMVDLIGVCVAGSNFKRTPSYELKGGSISDLKKSFMKKLFSYDQPLEVLVYFNKLKADDVTVSNARISVVEKTISVLEEELDYFSKSEAILDLPELDDQGVIQLRGFNSYSELKDSEQERLVLWTYNKVIYDAPDLARALAKYDPSLSHNKELLLKRVEKFENSVNWLTEYKDVVSELNPNINQTIEQYSAILDQVRAKLEA